MIGTRKSLCKLQSDFDWTMIRRSAVIDPDLYKFPG